MAQTPVTAVVVGAGNRAMYYSSFALQRPDMLKIVGVAEPSERRRQLAAERFGLSPEQCFDSAQELADKPNMADAVINGTMDQFHVPTSLPLLAAGYDILLEKPFATSEREMRELIQAANRHEKKVMICHLMRYISFWRAIKERVARGEIGEVINIQTNEHVSYHHMAVAYIRGKWARQAVSGSPMLMSKCCHDLDVIMWMKSGIRPRSVSSFGSNIQFRPENAPEGAGTRCLVDCPIESDCLYSARKHYIDHPDRWSHYVWDKLERAEDLTPAQKYDFLKSDSPYGRCVWRADMDVVDHQSVAIEFEDGSTATHNLVGGSPRPVRTIHLIGTIGEIQGVYEESRFVVRHIDPRPGHEYSEESVSVDVTGDMQGAKGGHGGGDMRLVADFVNFVRGEPRSISCTSIDDSVNGHLVGFRADEAMRERRVVDIPAA